MKPTSQGFSVGVVGASSLLGKELLAVLKERDFPVARLVTAEDDEGEPDIPVVDLREGLEPSIADENLTEEDFDFVFVAAPPSPPSGKAPAAGRESFLRSPSLLARATRCVVIDLCGGWAGKPGGTVRIPFLESPGRRSPARGPESARRFVGADSATIVLAGLLAHLASHFKITTAVAQVLVPASEIGPQAVDELQHQTSSLLSFKKLPEAVFGRQLAFNLLPRFGSTRQKGGALAAIESCVHQQVNSYLSAHAEIQKRLPTPSLRVIQVPVFHSVAISLYVETAEAASVEEIERALKHERIKTTRLRDPAPSQADTSGSGDIQVDAVQRDAGHKNGAWIWAVADNLRLASVNAVEIAEAERERVHAIEH